MRFSELVRLLEEGGFRLINEKGSIRSYTSRDIPPRPRRLSRQQGSADGHAVSAMLDIPYSIVIEATDDPEFFGFFSPELEAFTGVGHSVEDCIYKARYGLADHVQAMKEQGLPVPPRNSDPTITVQNERKRYVA